MKEIKIYTNDGCKQCELAKKYLTDNNVEFEELNISKKSIYRKELIQRGYLSVPVLIIGDDEVLGFDKERINYLIKK